MPKVTATKIKLGKKGKKDPNKPKRGRSAYMFFAQDNRERIQKENPKATFGEIGKLMGAEWNKLTDKDKKPYSEKAEKDKERYEKEKAVYEGNAAESE